MSAGDDLYDAVRRHADALEGASRDLAQLDDDSREHRRLAGVAVDDALREIGEIALPSPMDDARLDGLATTLHLPALEARRARALVAQRRAELSGTLDALARDPRLPDAAARLALLDARARELLEPAAALRESVRSLRQDRDFQEFLAGEANRRWWTFSFHRARAAGERAVQRHGARRRVKDASALALKHRDEREALRTLEGELAAIASERGALLHLLAEHERASAALPEVERGLLRELRATLSATLRFLDDETLLSRLCDPPLRAPARRLSGCRARVRYLDALYLHYVDRTRREHASHLQDTALVLQRSGAPRRGLGETVAEVEATTRRRRRELEERARVYRATADRLLAFTRWDEHDPLAGELWWDAFTGGLGDGSFIDEVTWHRTMGRPRGGRHAGGEVDRRAGWARNAANATAALAAAHAEVLARDGNDGDAGGAGDGGDGRDVADVRDDPDDGAER